MKHQVDEKERRHFVHTNCKPLNARVGKTTKKPQKPEEKKPPEIKPVKK